MTKEIHGKEEADNALAGARAAFSGGGDKEAMPTISLERSALQAGIGVVDLFASAGLGGSKSDIRRLIEQGGASVNGNSITDLKALISLKDADEAGEFILRAGKKKFVRVVLG